MFKRMKLRWKFREEIRRSKAAMKTYKKNRKYEPALLIPDSIWETFLEHYNKPPEPRQSARYKEQ